jgi:AraC-like DNA-binding protein
VEVSRETHFLLEQGRFVAALGFTKARSMGPVAEAVERAGGSVARVFRKAELPLRLIEEPEQLILLRDQLVLVEHAARELDDHALPLRLSTQAGMEGLGLFGRRVRTAPTLENAIERCNFGIQSMLQSMTRMDLKQTEGSAARLAAWTYEILDEAPVGRQKNELLAFGYMISTLKHFGAGAPLRVTLPRKPPERTALEDLLGCEIATGEKAALVFRAECLCNPNPAGVDPDDARIDDMPSPTDFSAAVERLVELALLERRPTIDAVRRRLALSARSLQRRLAEEGESFDAIRRRVVLGKARTRLSDGATPITQIAYELGYSDAAHFSRAFAAWTGESPRAWRRAALARACEAGLPPLGRRP